MSCGKVSELSPTFVVIKRTFMHYHCVWTTLCEMTVFIPIRKTIQINQYTHTYIQYNKEMVSGCVAALQVLISHHSHFLPVCAEAEI